jgi:hypothetical protein
MLKRIVALLFSFAGLAGRASGRSYPVRCLVLWALRRAEMVARDWIMDDMQSTAACAVLHRNSRAEAIYLARAFRALAHALKRELRLEERLARRLLRDRGHPATAESSRRGLLAPQALRRLAREMRVTIFRLNHPTFDIALRFDTS